VGNIQTSIGSADAFIQQIAAVPVVGVVIPLIPFHARPLGEEFIQLAHPCPLNLAKLLDAGSLGRLLSEAQLVHLAHDFEARGIVERQFRLVELPIRTRTTRLARGIQSHTGFTDPANTVPMRSARAAAACETRVPGSSIMQATPPTGIWVRTPFLSITTKAPSTTSICPYSMKISDTRSRIIMGFNGGSMGYSLHWSAAVNNAESSVFLGF
jgi:hypothetical protein